MGLTQGTIGKAVIAIVILVALFSVYASLVPEASSAGDELNASNQCGQSGCYWNATSSVCEDTQGSPTTCAVSNSVPLSGLFAGNGLVIIVLMATLLIITITALLKKSK